MIRSWRLYKAISASNVLALADLMPCFNEFIVNIPRQSRGIFTVLSSNVILLALIFPVNRLYEIKGSSSQKLAQAVSQCRESETFTDTVWRRNLQTHTSIHHSKPPPSALLWDTSPMLELDPHALRSFPSPCSRQCVCLDYRCLRSVLA